MGIVYEGLTMGFTHGLTGMRSCRNFELGFAVRGTGRIQANSLKEFKVLVKQLSKPGSELTKTELIQLENLASQYGGKLRYDLNPVKGKIIKPHVQIEGLGSSIQNRNIWLGKGIKKFNDGANNCC